MQIAFTRIWTWIVRSVPYDDSYYATSTSDNIFVYVYTYIVSYFWGYIETYVDKTDLHMSPCVLYIYIYGLLDFFCVYYNMQYKLHLKQEKQGTSKVSNNLYKQ